MFKVGDYSGALLFISLLKVAPLSIVGLFSFFWLFKSSEFPAVYPLPVLVFSGVVFGCFLGVVYRLSTKTAANYINY